MPKAEAMVSPENEDSNTTKPPWTPLSAMSTKSRWENCQRNLVGDSLLKLSANSPKSIDRTHLIKRWFVQMIGSIFSLSDCKRRIASAWRSYFIILSKWMPWTTLAWWNFRVTPKYFSSSFFESVSSILASTSECINDSEYCDNPISWSHSKAHQLREKIEI